MCIFPIRNNIFLHEIVSWGKTVDRVNHAEICRLSYQFQHTGGW